MRIRQKEKETDSEFKFIILIILNFYTVITSKAANEVWRIATDWKERLFIEGRRVKSLIIHMKYAKET